MNNQFYRRIELSEFDERQAWLAAVHTETVQQIDGENKTKQCSSIGFCSNVTDVSDEFGTRAKNDHRSAARMHTLDREFFIVDNVGILNFDVKISSLE